MMAQTQRVQEQAQKERVDEFVKQHYHDDLAEIENVSNSVLPRDSHSDLPAREERTGSIMKRFIRAISSSSPKGCYLWVTVCLFIFRSDEKGRTRHTHSKQ
jgi:hypothetical protein